jgi:hypothetical protein
MRRTVQLPAPRLPPDLVPPPSGFLDFVMLCVLFVEIVLLALPRKIGNRILETLLPIVCRPHPKNKGGPAEADPLFVAQA